LFVTLTFDSLLAAAIDEVRTAGRTLELAYSPKSPRLARNTIIESTFEVGRRFRCTIRVDCSEPRPRRGDPDRGPASGTRISPTASTTRSLRTGAPARNAVYLSISLPH
jgi:hypothetical protein